MASLLWRLQGSVFVQNYLKGRLCKGQSVCSVTSRYEEHRQALAHSIIAEHMEITAGLRYTLPVFLSELATQAAQLFRSQPRIFVSSLASVCTHLLAASWQPMSRPRHLMPQEVSRDLQQSCYA